MIRNIFVVFVCASFALGSPVPDEFLERSGRIVGGTNVPLGRFPWMASTRMNGGHWCGASIINNRWLLSAAHCTVNSTPANTRVIVGSVMRSGAGGVDHALSRIVNHPNYTPGPLNDISVIQTASNIVFNANVRSIELGSAFVGAGVTAIAIGWGSTSHGGPQPAQLQMIETRTIANSQCGFPDTIQCTQVPAGRGICHGDSGSPLSSGGMQIGVAAWITQTCGNGSPDGFTRVSAFRTWILNTAR